MFNDGDKVIYIGSSSSYMTHNIKYKIFSILRGDKTYPDILYIYNDKHRLSEFISTSFISLQECRKQKLNKINETK